MPGQREEMDNIVNECLERLLSRGATVEQCLADHPEQAAELEPLLRTVVVAREAADVRPDESFRARARYQFQAAVRDMETKGERRRFWQPRWATALITLLVVLLASGGGTAAAAQNSMPDELLYPVKLTTEAVRLALSTSDLDRAELYVRLADRRVGEMAQMAREGNGEGMTRAAQMLERQLVSMADLMAPAAEGPLMMAAPPPAEDTVTGPSIQAAGGNEEAPAMLAEEKAPERAPMVADAPRSGNGNARGAQNGRRAQIGMELAERYAANTEALKELLEEVPPSLRPQLRQAIADAELSYQQALWAFGQR